MQIEFAHLSESFWRVENQRTSQPLWDWSGKTVTHVKIFTVACFKMDWVPDEVYQDYYKSQHHHHHHHINGWCRTLQHVWLLNMLDQINPKPWYVNFYSCYGACSVPGPKTHRFMFMWRPVLTDFLTRNNHQQHFQTCCVTQHPKD